MGLFSPLYTILRQIFFVEGQELLTCIRPQQIGLNVVPDALVSCHCVGLKEWISADETLAPSEEIIQPKRLLQQIHTDEEFLHSGLDTRVKNYTADVLVSLVCCSKLC